MPKIIVPKLGAYAPHCTVLCWLKQAGEKVLKGDALVELAVEKAIYNLDATQTGVLEKIYAPAGAVLPQGEVLGWLGTKAGEAVPNLMPRLLDWDDAIAPIPASFEPVLTEQAGKVAEVEEQNHEVLDKALLRPGKEERRLLYSKKLLGSLRRATRTRMRVSWQETPKVDLFCDVNCSQLIKKRSMLTSGSVPSYNSCIAWATIRAFERFPQYNLRWQKGRAEANSQIDVGLAVALHDELVTIRLEDALKLSLREINAGFRNLIRKAIHLNLSYQEQFGSSITITNLGELGVRHFTPIINPPEVFILSVGAFEERAVVIEGKVTVATICTIGVSFDHRAINGAPAARLLAEIKRQLEEPTFS